MITSYILYFILGCVLVSAGLSGLVWQYWVILLLVAAIDIWSDVCARRKG